MPRSEGQKLKLLYLKEIFEQNTDENHGLTMEQILIRLKNRGVSAERKSIYTDILTLSEDYEMDIELDKSVKPPVYKLLSRDFELPELKMMVDSIASSKFLSEAKTRVLIDKIKKLCSRHDAESLSRQVTIANRVKSMNTSIHINVDAIYQAIKANAQIKFRYFMFDLRKERKYNRNGDFYIVSPWRLIYVDDNYYLLAYDSKAKKFKHFRVDKMDSVDQVKVADMKVDRDGVKEFAKIDMSNYTKYTFAMFGGEKEDVTMIFQNRMMGVVIDRFGKDIMVMKEDDSHFRITAPVVVSEQFFGWICGLGRLVKIAAPDTVKEKFKNYLTGIQEQYKE